MKESKGCSDVHFAFSFDDKVEFQAAVAQLLKYCRHGEAKQLFRTLVHPGNVCLHFEFALFACLFFLLAQELVAAGGCVLLSLRPALRLTWQELGISKVEWTAHRMQKALNARRLDVQAKLNALAPLGASPRSLTEV
jgi:hypothetical protein